MIKIHSVQFSKFNLQKNVKVVLFFGQGNISIKGGK